jgi:hypothetical protein
MRALGHIARALIGKTMSSNQNDSNNSDKVFRRAKAWDGFLASEGEFISNDRASAAMGGVRFDGSTERSGGSTTDDIKNRIGACREAYENEGIIGNIIDLMVDFALEGIEITHKSAPIQKFYRQWAEKIDLMNLAEQVLKCTYRDGNVPILAYWGKISDQEVKSFKKAVGKTQANLFTENTVDGDKIIPYRFQVLDVLNLERAGSEMLGTAGWEYQFDKEDYESLSQDMDANTRAIVNQLKETLGPKEFNKIKSQGRMTLDPSMFDMLYYKKDGYKSWANPMLWRVIKDVKFKKMLRDMDISVAEGVTNALTIVKLGNTEAGLPPSKKKYQQVVNMLKNPSKSKTIVWDDLIDVQTVFPPVEKFFNPDKYNQVDNDIRSGLGIAEILVNGGGGNYSSSFLSVKTLLERLQMGRQTLLGWLQKQAAIVAKNMGFKSAPVIRMTNMSLNDQTTEKQFLLELFDRNAVSFETLTERFGENFDIEQERVRREDKKRSKIADDSPFSLLRVGKFGPQYPAGPPALQEVAENPVPGDDNLSNLPSAQEDNGQDGGRKSGEPQERSQRDEPAAPVGQKATSSLALTQVDDAFDMIYKTVCSAICEEKGYKNARSLTKEDRQRAMAEVVDAMPAVLVQALELDAQASDRFVADYGVAMNKSLSFAEETGITPGRLEIKEFNRKAVQTSVNNISK